QHVPRRVHQVTLDTVAVVDEHAQPDTDLWSGQAGAAFVGEGVGQVTHEAAQFLVEVDDLGGARAQHRIAEKANGLDGHALPRGGCDETGCSPVYVLPR